LEVFGFRWGFDASFINAIELVVFCLRELVVDDGLELLLLAERLE
jgi:hypothetical protein